MVFWASSEGVAGFGHHYLGHLCGAILDPLGILAQRQWKVLEIGGAPMMVRA